MMGMIELVGRDVTAVAAVALWIGMILLAWWVWPGWFELPALRRRDPRATTRRGPRDTSARSSRDVSPRVTRASWAVPPYDWRRRPAARVDLGLRREQLIGRRAAISDVGLLREPPEPHP